MPVKREADRYDIKPYVSRFTPLPIPNTTITASPQRCLTVNALWASHIIGALELLAQADTWLGSESERLDAVNNIEEIIVQLSNECQDCPDCPDCPDSDNPKDNTTDYENSSAVGCCDDSTEGDEEVGQVVTNVYVDEATRELVVQFGKCCEERYVMASAANQPNPSDITSEDPDYVPPAGAGSETCIKASALAAAFKDLADACITAVGQLPLSGVNTIKGAVDAFDMGWQQALGIYAASQAIERVVPIIELQFTAEMEQQLACQIEPMLTSGTLSLTTTEISAFKNQIYSVGGTPEGYQWKPMVEQITDAQWKAAAKSNAYAASVNCDCPAPAKLIIPGNPTWAKEIDFTQGDFGWYHQSGPNAYVAGQGWTASTAGGNRGFGSIRVDITPLSNTRLIYIYQEWTWPGGIVDRYAGSLVWLGANGTTIWGDPQGQPYVGLSPISAQVSFSLDAKSWWEIIVGNINNTTPPQDLTGNFVLTKLVVAGTGNCPVQNWPNY